MANYEFVEEDVGPVLDAFNRFNTITFDTETTGLNPLDSRLLLIQIGFPDVNFVILPKAAAPLIPYFSSPKWLKIIQNAKFDTKFLLHNYGIQVKNIFDTMLAEQLLEASDLRPSSSLATLAKKYLDIDLDKEVRNTFIGAIPQAAFTTEQLSYAGADVEILWGIKEAQEKRLKEEGLEKVAELEFELAPIVAAMELTGVPVDVSKWNKRIEAAKKEHEQSRLAMHEHLFDTGLFNEQIGMFERDAINLNSVPQVKKALQTLGLPIDATNERALSLVDHPAAKEMLNYRRLQKILSSYGSTFLGEIHPFDNKIHPDWQQIGTATGRFACKKPNLQQMPIEFRDCIGIDDYMIVGADFANIELRILAELSGDEALRSAFEAGDDPHKSTAALMFNLPIDMINKEQRFIAKTINFGISYGMGPTKLMDMLNKDKLEKDKLSYNKVSLIMRRYKETYKKASSWLLQTGNTAYRQGYSETMYGRKRWYSRPEASTGNWDGQVAAIKRQGANSPIQGTNADITKLAMKNLYDDLKTYGFRAEMILQVHDEIGLLAHKSQSEDVKLLVVESMQKSAQQLLTRVPVKVDAYVAPYWSK